MDSYTHPPGGPEHPLYTKLNHTDSIRLLSIHGRAPGPTAPLECSIRYARLSEAPSYKALSYAWREIGSYSTTNTKLPKIYCNGVSFSVLTNLHHALLHLRDSFGPDQLFWIDFLCINQGDLAEKSTLTSIMSEIYRSAEQVVVWLGPGSADTSLAIDLFRTFANLSPEQHAAFAHIKDLGIKQRPDESFARSIMVHDAILSSRAHWIALASFFRRSWFSRCWVAQEVLLAKTILILCGRYQLTWATLCKVSHYLTKNAQSIEMMRETFFDRRHFASLGSEIPIVEDQEDSHVPHYDMPTRLAASLDALAHPDIDQPSSQDDVSPLLKHLIRSRRLKCLDPRDTIYSLLGVVPASNVPLPVPNYHLNPATVYHQTAISILQSSSDLLLLAHAEGARFRKYDELPSWVPDWSVRKGLGLGITGYKRFDACPGRDRVALVSNDERVLTIEAAIFDQIIMVGESKRDVLRTGRCEEWIKIAISLKEKFGLENKMVLDCLWRCLITDTAWSETAGKDHPASQTLQQCFLTWAKETLLGSQAETSVHEQNWLDVLGRGLGVNRRTADKQGLNANDETRLSATAAKYDTVYRFAVHLKLLLTRGGLICLGTESVEDGDMVAIVSGSRVPLIFRPRVEGDGVGQYELIGATYVHGCMHGEVCQRDDVDFSMLEIS